MKDTLFLTAWANSRTKNIIDGIDIERMIDAKDFKEAKGVLQDSDYAPYLMSQSGVSMEKIFQKDREWLRKTLRIMGLEKEVEDFLFLDEDLFLLRVVLQEGIFGTKFSEGVEKILDEKRVDRIREKFSEEIKEIAGEKLKTPTELSDKITSIYWNKKLQYAKKFGEEKLENFLREYEDVGRQQRLLEVAEREENDSSNSKNDNTDGGLNKMESEFIEFAGRIFEGVTPLFVFSLRKKKAENLARMILGAKEMEMSSSEIHRMVSGIRAML